MSFLNSAGVLRGAVRKGLVCGLAFGLLSVAAVAAPPVKTTKTSATQSAKGRTALTKPKTVSSSKPKTTPKPTSTRGPIRLGGLRGRLFCDPSGGGVPEIDPASAGVGLSVLIGLLCLTVDLCGASYLTAKAE